MARELSLQEILVASFDAQMSNQYTAIPCIVVAITDGLNGQMVSIQPTINQKFKDGTVEERPVIVGVPVSFPISKTGGMTFPVSVGDTGTAIFSMRNMDAWKAGNGRPSSPLNFAKMDKQDAIFFPGIQPPGVAVNNPGKHILSHNTSDVVMFANLGATEAEVRIKADGSIEINTSDRPVTINCSEATINANTSMNINSPAMIIDVPNMTFIGDITHQGDYTQVGTYTLNTVNINLHRHVGVTAGNGTSGTMV